MSFPNENKLSSEKDGSDITAADSRKELSYTESPYLYNFTEVLPTNEIYFQQLDYVWWDITEDVSRPFFASLLWRSITPPINTVFPNNDKTLNGKDGEDITELNAKKQASYDVAPYNYVFGIDEWKIDEDVTFPYFVEVIVPPPEPTGEGNAKAFLVDAWNDYAMKTYNAVWVQHALKYWNGGAWIE